LRWVAAAVDLGLNTLSALFYSIQLVLPVSLESLGPLVERLDGRGVGAVEAVTAVAADAHEVDAAENAKVL
jgi:hypothetical protein